MLDILKKLDILINRQREEVVTVKQEEDVKTVISVNETAYTGLLGKAIQFLEGEPEYLQLSGRDLASRVELDGKLISYRTWNKAKKIITESED